MSKCDAKTGNRSIAKDVKIADLGQQARCKQQTRKNAQRHKGDPEQTLHLNTVKHHTVVCEFGEHAVECAGVSPGNIQQKAYTCTCVVRDSGKTIRIRHR